VETETDGAFDVELNSFEQLVNMFSKDSIQFKERQVFVMSTFGGW
jgi:hypothetical protein